MKSMPVFFHLDQLNHRPVYEWAFGEKFAHPETNSRAANILAALKKEGSKYELIIPQYIPMQLLKETHDQTLLTLYKNAEKKTTGRNILSKCLPQKK